MAHEIGTKLKDNIRATYYVRRLSHNRLKKAASLTGRSMSEVISLALDHYIEHLKATKEIPSTL